MGIDAEKVLVCVWRFLQFFMKTSYQCVEKQPFVSGILVSLFIVYIFFNFLVYYSPFLVFIAVLLRFFWSSGQPTIVVQDVKATEKKNDRILSNESSSSVEEEHVVHGNNDSSCLQNQRSRRRNFKDKNRQWDAQAGKENKGMVPSSTTPNDNSIHKTAVIDRNQKVDVEEKESSKEHGQSSVSGALVTDLSGEKTHKNCGGGDVLETEHLEDGEDDEEEETQEDGNNAMEWTEDDEKNLMDLGLSEIERNKRLESLISKRRARKIFKMQVEKAFHHLDSSTCQIAPLIIAKTGTLSIANNSNEIDSLQMPGSAPSVLLPTQNPFDLPYDPFEEKPNLMADSFQQEFTEAHQKEMLFCRHESFSLGPSFPFESKQEKNDKFSPLFVPEKRALEGLGYSRFRKLSDKGHHDQLVEHLMSENHNHKPYVNHPPDVIESGLDFPTQAIDSEVSKDEGNGKFITDMIDVVKDKTPKGNDNPMESMYARSEVHLEPHVIEDSNDDSGSLSLSSSSSSSGTTENIFNFSKAGIPKPREGYAARSSFACLSPKNLPSKESLNYDSSPNSNDKSRMDDRFFYNHKAPCHSSTYSIASDLQVEVSESGSPPGTVNENNSPTDTDSLTSFGEVEKNQSIGLEHKAIDDTRQEMEVVREIEDSHSLSTENLEESMQLTEKLEADQAPENTEEAFTPFNESKMEANNVDNGIAPVADTTDDIGKEDEDRDSGVEMLIQQAAVRELPKPAEETMLETHKHSDGENSEYSTDHQTMGNEDLNLPQMMLQQEIKQELPKPIEETELESNKHIEDSSENPTDQPVQPNEGNENLNLIGDSEELQILVQHEIDGEWPKSAQEVKLESNMHIEDNSNNADEHQPMDTVQSNEGIKDLNLIGYSEKQTAQEGGTTDISKAIEAEENLISVEGDKNVQSSVESEVFGSENPIVPVVQQLSVNEDVPVNSSSSPSATSGHIPEDEACHTNIDDGAPMQIQKEIIGKLPKPTEETKLESNMDIELNSDRQPLDSEQLNEAIKNLDLTEDGEKLTLQEGGITDMSNPIEDEGKLLLSQNSKEEHSFVESGGFHTNQSSDDPTASAVAAEEVPAISSSSSSPTSVLSKHIPVGEMSSASLCEMVHMDVPQSEVEAMVRSSSSDELQPDIEPSNPPENFTNEANIIAGKNELLIDDKVGIEESESNKATEGDSRTVFNPGALAGLSNSEPETHTTSIEDTDNVSGKSAEAETDPPSKLPHEEAIDKMKDPEVKEKEDMEDN
ncbi:hypothetical protein FNV43_RR17824 [Rhamnella rubrinervis]|uniref:Uncharacterized protein n=1 Tax=Rhamnella rubrinervis TaxID=2594499 RepID=A0A8K0E3C7_9ROSA|nr:hypothetical protein FNV43_RR17824 [Rhamnella rubrinervis]